MTLRVLRGTDAWRGDPAVSARRTAIAIGNFDGGHLGHQAILRRVVRHARRSGSLATAITFDPHPLKVLRPEHAPQLISTLNERLAWMAELGVDAVLLLPFTRALSQVSAEDFTAEVLAATLHAERIFVGENFCFGHRHAGNVALLKRLSARFDYTVEIVPPFVRSGEIVSSTAVRRAIQEGHMEEAARLLGRPYTLTGKIVDGTGTGRRETVPTLNLECEQELLPAHGVYVTEARLSAATPPGTERVAPASRRPRDESLHWHPAATNLGTRPTFDGAGFTIETHLLDSNALFAVSRGADPSVRPVSMELRFWKRLRSEMKFPSSAALKKQIESDVRRARAFFRRRRSRRRSKQPA